MRSAKTALPDDDAHPTQLTIRVILSAVIVSERSRRIFWECRRSFGCAQDDSDGKGDDSDGKRG